MAGRGRLRLRRQILVHCEQQVNERRTWVVLVFDQNHSCASILA
jgi:hypothetical protein